MAQTSCSSETSEQSSKVSTKSGNGKVKPSYKHIPHSQKPPHLVAKRNARERRRVQAVNQAFYKLRKCVPIENRNKRVSKVKTLQRAIDYIRKLEQTLAEDDEANAATITPASLSANSQYGSASQVVTGLNSNSQQQQQQQQTNTVNNAQRRAKKSTICDQEQPNTTKISTLVDSNQQPQIMRQKRGRKTNQIHDSAPKRLVQVIADPLTINNNNNNTILQTRDSLPNTANCQQVVSTSSYNNSNSLQIHNDDPPPPIDIQSIKFPPEPYYCPQTAVYNQLTLNNHQSIHEQPAEVLRESSAYNNNLNYYNEHQQQQYSTYLTSIPTSSSSNEPLPPTSMQQQQQHPNQYDMYTTGYTTNSFNYNPAQLNNYTSYAVAEASSSSNTAAYLAPETPEPLNGGWQRVSAITNGDHSPALASSAKSEITMSLNDSVVGSSTSNSTTSSKLSSTPLTSSTTNRTPDSTSTRPASSLVLLQSPTSSTSSNNSSSTVNQNSASSSSSAASSASSLSSATSSSVASVSSSSLSSTANSDNSSTAAVVCRQAKNSPTNVNRQQQQQVNNYLAYAVASNRMEARAAHLSFASSNNDNNSGSHNGYHHRQQQQQQLNEQQLRKTTTNNNPNELLAIGSGHHQVRHLLNGTANNLHDQHQPQYQLHNNNNNLHHNHQHHLQQQQNQQQSLYQSNQHSNQNHLSALQSMANISTLPSTSIANTSLLLHQQQQTIQEYH